MNEQATTKKPTAPNRTEETDAYNRTTAPNQQDRKKWALEPRKSEREAEQEEEVKSKKQHIGFANVPFAHIKYSSHVFGLYKVSF